MRWFVSAGLCLFFFFALGFLFAERAGWTDEVWMSEHLVALSSHPGGLIGLAAVMIALLTLDLFLPMPSSVVMVLAGAVFGLHVGWMITLTGAMGSALLGFFICRYWGKPAFDRVVGQVDAERITRFFERHGLWAILLSRSVPMLTEIISCLAGLSAMRFRLFLIASLAGTWPLCVVYAWAGHRALDESAVGWAVLLAFVLPALGFLALNWRPRHSGT
jgi:uncharacterized membrane protein YdjX (TVP38/TMEM64 family)